MAIAYLSFTLCAEELLFGVIACFVTACAILYFQPYANNGDALVAFFAQLALFCTLASAMVLKADASSPTLDAALTSLLLLPLVLAVVLDAGLGYSGTRVLGKMHVTTAVDKLVKPAGRKALATIDKRLHTKTLDSNSSARAQSEGPPVGMSEAAPTASNELRLRA